MNDNDDESKGLTSSTNTSPELEEEYEDLDVNGVASEIRRRKADPRMIEVEEERETIIEDDKIVEKITRTWKVQSFEMLPHWLRDNEYILHGHRPPLPSFVDCFKSIFSIHCETGNIWTHLLGCLGFFFLAVWFLSREKDHINLQEKIVFSFFFAGAIICLGCSFVFHTLSCHSPNVSKLFKKLDYTGISMLIIGSFVPYIYYSFYCRPTLKIIYMSMICLIGSAAISVSLLDKFGEYQYRSIRAAVFVAMGLSGVVPAIHLMITYGIEKLSNEMSFIPLVVMGFLYIFGAALYGGRIPEKYFPGKFDIWFHSHQLFHICVVVAAVTHFYGIQKLAHFRLTEEQCL